MHLIPASASHLHVLVTVFPSVGLIFALGFYIASLITNNESMKRYCLLSFGVLGLLAIPTYFSGASSMLVMAKDPKVSADLMDSHYWWGMYGLGILVILGITAFVNLMRAKPGKALSLDAIHLVMGLGVITLAMMVVVDEKGWEIAHHELQVVTQGPNTAIASASDIPDDTQTSQGWSHVHMIVNHFPTVGFVFSLAFFAFGLFMKNVVAQRAGLVALVACAVMGVPTYATGAGAMWAIQEMEGISKPAINAHRDMAAFTLIGLMFTGGCAYFEVWRYRYLGRFSPRMLNAVLVLAVITLGIMAETGHRGGQINHPEIRTEALPSDAIYYFTPNVELAINNVIWFVPWQTVHFFGYSIVFGTVLAVSLRVLGFWKSVPFSAVHRLLPLGVFGVMMNVFTGMLMLMADTFRYINETTFAPKMFLLPLGAILVLYFSLSDRLWAVKAGEDAPMTSKWITSAVLLSWIGVIMGGRLLPYL